MADEGLAKKDRICQFFASNAGLHFRSVDVAAALGLDARSVGQQLARLWRSGFVEKVQTGPFTTWRMKFQTYPGRNLHGPAAPKPAGLTQHTPAKKSTRGSRTHEEGRNESGHCAMGSPVVLGSTEGGNQEGEEYDETEDQGSCLVEAHSVRVPEYHSSSSKPPAATRDGPTSTQNISSQCKAGKNPPIKKTVGRPPGNKNKMSTTCQIGQRGSRTGKTSSNSGSCKKKTSAPVMRRVGPESCRNADQGLKGKKKTSQSKGDCSSRSVTDSESSQKIVPTGLKRKAGATNTVQGLKKKVKKTRTQTTGREDCRSRNRPQDSGLSSKGQKKTHCQLVPASVSCQKTTATAVKRKTDQGHKRRMKKTTPPNTEVYSSSTCSTSWKDPVQHNPTLMPTTLAPSLNRPSGNMETKLMNFICEAQGMLVMTGDDVAKALGSKPKETHRLLLHMQRTGRVRKVCDKPTRWMMLGQGRGGPAKKRQIETTTTSKQKEVPSLTTAQRKGPSQTKHQELSTQAYRSLFIDGSPTRRRQEKATTTTQQKEPTKHQVPSTQTYRSLSTDGSTEEGTLKTSSSTRNLSECGQVYGMRFETQTSLCEEEEEDSEKIVSTSTQVSAEFGTCLATVEEEDLEDFSCVSQEEDSGFLEDATFYTERKKPSPRVQQASSLPSKKQSRKSNQKSQGEDIRRVFQEQDSGFLEDVTFYAERKKSSPTALSLSSKKQSKTSNQTSQVVTTTRRCLSPCGKYVKKTPVKKQVLTDKQSVRKTTKHGSSCSKPTAAKSTSLGNLQSQNSNHTGVSSTSWQAKKLGLSNFRIPKKNSLPGKQLGKSQLTVGQNSRDLCESKRMSVAPSELDDSLLDSSKDSTCKSKQDTNTQRDISIIKTPPHILKHSVSYFASTTKEPDIKPKLPRPSKTSKDIPKPQDQTETSFVRGKDNSVSLKEPLSDLDVMMVNVTVDKSPQIQNQVHSCGTCGSNKDLQHTPLSVLRRNSTQTPPSGPPKLYPQRATESIGKQCMVGTLGSCDSPPVLVHQEEELRSLGTESPSSLRAARRNLNPCFSLEENFLSSQDTGTDPRRAHGRGVYAEIKDSSRVTGGEVIGQAGHGSWHSTFTSLHEQQCGKGLSCSQGQIRNNRQANFTSLEPKTAVAKTTNAGVASFIDTKQHRMTGIDDRAHCIGPVLGAEVLVHHPLDYHRTGHTCSVHQMDSSGQGGDRTDLGRPQKSEKVHQALVTSQAACFEVSAPREVPRMSVVGDEEKLARGTIDLTQEKKFTKTSWPKPTDYWCDGVQDVFHAKDRKLSSDTEELLTTSTYAASEAKARRCISSTEEIVAHTTTAHTASDNILPAKVRNLLFGTEKAVPDITSMHTASEDVFPAIARRLSFGTEETVPHRTVTHIAMSNVGHPSKSDNVSILEEQALHAKVSNSTAQSGTLCKVSDTPLRNSTGALVPSYVAKSMQPSHDCITTANHKGAPIQATRSPTGSAPVLGADQHVHCIGVKQSPVNPEVLCISNKTQQNESTKWQRPRSPKSFWIDYWSKAESKDTKCDDLKDRSAENSRLVACSTTNADNVDSPKEPSSDLMKNYSQSKVCAMEVLSKDNANFLDEKSLTVSKEERKLFCSTETQTSETFVRTSQVQTEGFIDLREDSKKQDLYAGSVDVKVSLEEREDSVVSSLTGPIEQSTWTQPKALYATDEKKPREQEKTEVQEPRGQEEAAVVEVRGSDGSKVDQVSRPQVSVAMVTPQGSRPVVMSALPSDTSLHPAPPIPVSQQSHPIVQLNELCQRNHLPMCFQDISVTGPAHRPRVQIAAVVGDCKFQAEASSKKAARRQALYQEGYK